MTQKRLSLLTAAAVALAVIVTGATYAQPGPPQGAGPGQGPRAGGPPSRGLQLTDEQRTKLEALIKEQRDRARTVRGEVQKLREQLNTELFADKLDEAKIKQLRGELAKAQQDMLGARLDQQTKLAQILTPEQRKLMREQRDLRAIQGMMRGFGGGRRGPGMGPGRRMGPGGFRGPGFDQRRGPGMGPGPGPGQGFGPRWRRWDEPVG